MIGKQFYSMLYAVHVQSEFRIHCVFVNIYGGRMKKAGFLVQFFFRSKQFINQIESNGKRDHWQNIHQIIWHSRMPDAGQREGDLWMYWIGFC